MKPGNYPIFPPLESAEAAVLFVRHGERNGGEDIYAIEELAELIQAVCKIVRYGENGHMCRSDLIEEMSHVYLILNHLRFKYDISVGELQEAMDDKIEKFLHIKNDLGGYKT